MTIILHAVLTVLSDAFLTARAVASVHVQWMLANFWHKQLTIYHIWGSKTVLCMLFGITASDWSLFIRYGRRLVLQVLLQEGDVAVQMPCVA